jgi:hypothetical protein
MLLKLNTENENVYILQPSQWRAMLRRKTSGVTATHRLRSAATGWRPEAQAGQAGRGAVRFSESCFV